MSALHLSFHALARLRSRGVCSSLALGLVTSLVLNGRATQHSSQLLPLSSRPASQLAQSMTTTW